jgi:hypothetical protein
MLINSYFLDNHSEIKSKTRKIFKVKSSFKDNPHNPPNDYPESEFLITYYYLL